MFQKIEKIQKMVDYLLGYFTESGIGQPQPRPSETQSSERYLSLGENILKAQDGVLSRRSALEMQRLLLHDERALHYYIDFQQLTVLLYEHFNPGRLACPLREADLLPAD